MIIQNHRDMVKALVKNPQEICENLDHFKVDVLHAILGIGSEAGELVDNVKRLIVYNKSPDIENIIEELGDLEFYMEQLRQVLDITREQTLQANIEKLAKRYPNFVYTDQKALERADKV